MRLIDADEAYDVLSEYYHQRTEIQHKALQEALDRVPTVDAVPVVRCRDCKHKRMVLKSGCLGCDIQCGLHPYDWYCPNGEKVTE